MRHRQYFFTDQHRWSQMKMRRVEGRDPVTQAILGAAFEVSNTLGRGFLESVYQRALAQELSLRGQEVAREVRFAVSYKGVDIGTYIADMIVAREVIVELKAVNGPISGPQIAQCLNYLKASGLQKGLILNFGQSRIEFNRLVL